MRGLENVILNFGPVPHEEAHPLEQVYIHNIIRELRGWKNFDDYRFYILNAYEPKDFKFDQNSIIIYLSNEDHVIPKELLVAKAVFTPYRPLVNPPKNCFEIPLGYNGSLESLPIIPVAERPLDIFFLGNLHRKRILFFIYTKIHKFFYNTGKALSRAKTKEYIVFSRKFTGGVKPAEYSDILMNSKIALVPEGYKSDISFRFFEAAKYGNVIITKRLYDYWFFKDFPGIQVESWRELGRTIRNLLKNESEMRSIQQKTIAYYEKNCSEKAVSDYMIKRISELNS